jgi:hypothetical protein
MALGLPAMDQCAIYVHKESTPMQLPERGLAEIVLQCLVLTKEQLHAVPVPLENSQVVALVSIASLASINRTQVPSIVCPAQEIKLLLRVHNRLLIALAVFSDMAIAIPPQRVLFAWLEHSPI